MASEDNDFRLLMRRVVAGDDDAARQLVEEYGESIRRAVRRVLDSRLRSKFDSLDFAQLVWGSFFRARDRMDRFDRPGELAAFLITMARNKVGTERRRYLRTVKRGANYEHEWIKTSLAEEAKIPDARLNEAIDVVIADEMLERMLADQPPRFRKIIQLRLQGKTHDEIAQALHLTRSAVHRFLKRLSEEHGK
jgi:RNA polymerase sigma factor (sigma-70 family)